MGVRAKLVNIFLAFVVTLAATHLYFRYTYNRTFKIYDDGVSETTYTLLALQGIKAAGLRLFVESHELLIMRTDRGQRDLAAEEMFDAREGFAEAAQQLALGLEAYERFAEGPGEQANIPELREISGSIVSRTEEIMGADPSDYLPLRVEMEELEDRFLERVDTGIDRSLVHFEGEKTRAFEQMALAKRVSLGLLLLFMIVGVGTAFRLFQSIISGVTQLTEASAKAATGDLSVRVKVESRDELGEMAGSFNKMLADLAESNERRREVEIRLRKLSRAVEQSAGAVVITDTRGTIEYVNPGFTRLTGYTPDEVVGQNPRILKTGHTSARTYEDLWETISSGKDWRGEFLNRTKSGETYWAAALISPIRDPAGKITNFVALQEDVTERKAIEAELRQSKATAQSRSLELQQANVELRELDERKTEFLATVSHELRTPLTAMLAAADVIKRYHAERPDVVSRFGDTIVSEGKRLGRLIDDVLDLTKMESGMGEWRDDRLNPKSIVEYALEVFRSKAAEHGIVLEVDVPELLPRVYGDRDRLVQVLTNLLSNAVKFTPSDGAITVSVREKEGFLLFEVRDTGVGIPEDELESVFDRFYQVTGGRYNTNKPPGTGLGLAICRDIVERHGGLIWAESGGERGATVCFTIPIAGERRGTAKREGEEGRSTEARIASDNG